MFTMYPKVMLARGYYGARKSEEGNGAHLGLIHQAPVLEKIEVAVTSRTSHEHAICPRGMYKSGQAAMYHSCNELHRETIWR